MLSLPSPRFLFGAAAASLLLACAGSDPELPAMLQPDLAIPALPALHALGVKIALVDDGMGAAFATQNGSTVHVPKADLVGKFLYFATTPVGKAAANAKPIDIGVGRIGADLTALLTTPAKYQDGPWELAVFVSVSNGNPAQGPQPGDLAAFDISKPPAGEPPVTGTTVRLHVNGADAAVTLDNKYFIRF
jgi:hypothetical protein